jgi:hypothetical protein
MMAKQKVASASSSAAASAMAEAEHKALAALQSPPPSDVYSSLAQKESDLVLAAELGNALLQKNEELRLHNEAMAEEFSDKLEVRNGSLCYQIDLNEDACIYTLICRD